ncbi:MAG: sodium:proton antiporter NhaD [Bacteroidales bacterium]|nr:sodium:proton antiporter NhaD [Bacteroidales bacterium]
MFVLMIIVFVIGYICIAFEHKLKIDKAATALMLGALMWMLFVMGKDAILNRTNPENAAWKAHCEANAISDPHDEEAQNKYIIKEESLNHLGETSETLFFLLGAMTIVAIIDKHNGFTIITDKIKTRNKKRLLWLLSVIAFFMSAVLDNLTTTIVMVTLLNKLVADKHLRWIYAGMIILAANAGGAWSPIGDVTTIMLWIGGYITAAKVVAMLIVPSLVSMIIPLIVLGFSLKGELEEPVENPEMLKSAPESRMKGFCLYWGIGSLLMVPILKTCLHVPPYMGMILLLGLFWLITDRVHHNKGDHRENSVAKVLTGVDVPTILFFLGILTAVAALQTAGHLAWMAHGLDKLCNSNTYGIGIAIGVFSSIVDNVPLVAGSMGMYELGASPDLVLDGTFWQLLAYCAGTGGSILIIGSAAGVAAMGLENIEFGWYVKHISWLALIGYFSGALCFWLMHTAFA